MFEAVRGGRHGAVTRRCAVMQRGVAARDGSLCDALRGATRGARHGSVARGG